MCFYNLVKWRAFPQERLWYELQREDRKKERIQFADESRHIAVLNDIRVDTGRYQLRR